MSSTKIENSRKYFNKAITLLSESSSVTNINKSIVLFNKSNKRMGDKHIPSLNGLATCYTELHKIKKAKDIYDKNMDIQKASDITTINSYLNYCTKVGDVSLAIKLCNILIEKFPPSVYTVYTYVKLNLEENNLNLLDKFNLNELPKEHKLIYMRIAAILYERNNEYKRAWLNYYKSNRLVYNLPSVTLMMDEYRKTFKDVRTKIKENKFSKINNAIPVVFIIGCPKSGLNLVNSLLTESDLFYATDVKLDIAGILEKYKNHNNETDNKSEGENVNIDSNEIFVELYNNMKEIYNSSDYRKNSKYILQSQQDINLYVGVIHKIFTNVKFIVCNRNLKDTAISLFTSFDYDNSMNWTNDLMSIVNYIKFNKELLDYWDIPASDTHTVNYEELVKDPQNTVDSICDFLKEPKHKIDFVHQQKRNYNTENIAKLKMKIHTDSIDRYKNYERYASELSLL